MDESVHRPAVVLGFVLACLVLSPLMAQQPNEATDHTRHRADVRAYAKPSGDVNIDIWVDDEARIAPAAALSQAMPCRWTEDEDSSNYAEGTCLRLLSGDGFYAEGLVDLGPLVGALRAVGATEVHVTLDVAGEPIPNPGPAWREQIQSVGLPGLRSDRCSYRLVWREGVPLPQPTLVRIGQPFRPSRLLTALALVLIVPVMLAWWMRRAGADNRAPTSAIVPLNWIILAAWLYWIYAVPLNDFIGLGFQLRLGSTAATLAVAVAAYAFPLLAATGSCVLVLASSERLDGDSARWRSFRNNLAAQSTFILPLGLFFIGGGFFEYDRGASMVSLPLAYVAYRLLCRISWRLRFSPMQLITSGALYDRVAATARAAGVRLTGVYKVGSRLAMEANAFAAGKGQIMLTRGLIERLTPREVDAIVAHEAGHLRSRHGLIRTLGLVACFAGAQAAFALEHRLGVPPWVGSIPIVPVVLVFAMARLSRAHELSADARAVEITRDPEGAIAAQARLARITLSPAEWGDIQGSILSHPSMRARVLALAHRFDVAPERALAILNDPDSIAAESQIPTSEVTSPQGVAETSDTPPPASTHRSPPAEWGEPLFNTSTKSSYISWTSWAANIALVAALAAVALLAEPFMMLKPLWMFSILVLGIPAAAWCSLRAAKIVNWLIQKPLERRIKARLKPASDAIHVALLPGECFTIIEGFYAWDLGFVSLAPSWLTYTGERTRFSVSRASVSEIRVTSGPAAWGRSYGVLVKCAESAFILESGGTRRKSRRLQARLTTWWQGALVPDAPVANEAPFSPPSLPWFAPAPRSRWRTALYMAKTAAMLFAGTLVALATAVPMTARTSLLSLVPFLAPLAYVTAVCPVLFGRSPDCPRSAAPTLRDYCADCSYKRKSLLAEPGK